MFSPFERMVAFRYLRARRAEGFISVIAGFSLLGIALGVATLIIVMAVMNGFREELLTRIVGLNGHATVQSMTGSVAEWEERARSSDREGGRSPDEKSGGRRPRGRSRRRRRREPAAAEDS